MVRLKRASSFTCYRVSQTHVLSLVETKYPECIRGRLPFTEMSRPNIPSGTLCVLNGKMDLGIYTELRPLIGTTVRVVKVCKSGLVQIETMD
jgi:hypothetical protein